jgi:hypothetical protein
MTISKPKTDFPEAAQIEQHLRKSSGKRSALKFWVMEDGNYASVGGESGAYFIVYNILTWEDLHAANASHVRYDWNSDKRHLFLLASSSAIAWLIGGLSFIFWDYRDISRFDSSELDAAIMLFSVIAAIILTYQTINQGHQMSLMTKIQSEKHVIPDQPPVRRKAADPTPQTPLSISTDDDGPL